MDENPYKSPKSAPKRVKKRLLPTPNDRWFFALLLLSIVFSLVATMLLLSMR